MLRTERIIADLSIIMEAEGDTLQVLIVVLVDHPGVPPGVMAQVAEFY